MTMNTQNISSIFQGPRAALIASGISSATSLRSAGTSATAGAVMTKPSKRLQEAQNLLQAQDLLGLPAQLLSGLPDPVRLRLRVPGAPVPVVLWTGHIRPQSRHATPVLADATRTGA